MAFALGACLAQEEPYDFTVAPNAGSPAAGGLHYQTDQFTGDFAYSYPVQLPPARRGFGPTVELRYSSSSGNGWCGKGWSLDFGYIERQTKFGVPKRWLASGAADTRYDDAKGFQFAFGGNASALVSVGTNLYRAEVERAFWTFEYVNNTYWLITDGEGVRHWLGENANSRMKHPTWNSSPVGNTTFRWAITRSEDRLGNQINYAYAADDGSHQLYPSQITWNQNVAAGLASSRTVAFTLENRLWDETVSFTTGYRVETKKRLREIRVTAGTQLARKIRLSYQKSPSTAVSRLWKFEEFGSDGDAGGAQPLPPTVLSYQDKPLEFDDAITWGPLAHPTTATQNEERWNSVRGQSFAYSFLDLLDVDRDGRPDRVMQDRSNPEDRYFVQFNTGTGFDATLRQISFLWPSSHGTAFARSGLSWDGPEFIGNEGCAHVMLLDIDDDGLPDRVQNPRYIGSVPPNQNVDLLYVEKGRGNAAFAAPSWFGPMDRQGFGQASGWNFPGYTIPDNADRAVVCQLIDMNGDGRPDRVMRKAQFPMNEILVQLHTGTGFGSVLKWTMANYYQPVASYWNNLVTLTHPEGPESASTSVGMFDMNGDGLPDRVSRKALSYSSTGYTAFIVQFNNGSGFEPWEEWGPLNHPSGTILSYGNPVSDDPNQAYPFNTWVLVNACLQDINGDGLLDRVCRRGTSPYDRFIVQINNGSGFEAPQDWMNVDDQGGTTLFQSGYRYPVAANSFVDLNDKGSDTHVDLADIDGDGLVDRVMRKNATSGWSTGLVVQKNSGPFPDLLRQIDNGVGGSVTVTYGSSSQFDNRDKTWTGNPWTTNALGLLPFSKQVVLSVTTNPGIGPVGTTTYSYRNGMYSSVHKEFRGFSEVTVTDPVGNVTVTDFHQGGGIVRTNEGEFQDADKRAKAGFAFRVERRGQDGKVYRRTWNKVDEAAPSAGRTFAWIAQTIVADYVPAVSPTQARLRATRYTYDTATGNLLVVADLGEVSSSQPWTHTLTDILTDDVYTTTTYATYLNGLGIFDQPLAELVTADAAGTQVLRRTDYGYNGATGDRYTMMRDSSALGDFTIRFWFRDNVGNLIGILDEDGIEYSTIYDAATRTFPTTVTADPSGLARVTTRTYDPRSGLVLTDTAPSGIASVTVYDQFYRSTEVRRRDALGAESWVQKSAYTLGGISGGQSNNRILGSVQNGIDLVLGRRTYTYADGFGRTIQTREESETAQYRVQALTYDAAGRASFRSRLYFANGSAHAAVPGGTAATTYSYDGLSRETAATPTAGDGTTSPTGALTTTWTSVDSTDPWAKTMRDATGRETELKADARGRPTTVRERQGAVWVPTTATYDDVGNLITLTDGDGRTKTFYYDMLGRQTHEFAPDSGLTITTYLGLNTVFSTQDANGQWVVWTYDALGRPTHRDGTLPGGPGTSTTWDYDAPADATHAVAIGQLAQVTDSEGWRRFSYDNYGRLAKTTRYVNATGASYVTTHTYDTANHLVVTTYPADVASTENTYDTAGHLTRIRALTGTPTAGEVLWQSTGFDASHRILVESMGNQTQTTRTYYPLSRRLQRIHTVGPTGTLQDLAYTFDAAGNIRSIADAVNAAATGGSFANIAYDDVHRLTGYQMGARAASFTWSPAGNTLTNTESGPLTYTYSSTQPHAVVNAHGKTYGYDANGNMIARGTQVLSYDELDHLTGVQDGLQNTTFGYEGDGRRLWRNTGSSLTLWIGSHYEVRGSQVWCNVYAGDRLVCAFSPAGAVAPGAQTPVLQPILLSAYTILYAHPDQVASPRVLTDAAGAIAQRHEYQAFGRSRFVLDPQGPTIGYRFTGEVADDTTGLYLFGERYYDPELGRFIQPDRMAPSMLSPQSLNPYSYALNNPLRWVDPSGLAPQDSQQKEEPEQEVLPLYMAGKDKFDYPFVVDHMMGSWKLTVVDDGTTKPYLHGRVPVGSVDPNNVRSWPGWSDEEFLKAWHEEVGQTNWDRAQIWKSVERDMQERQQERERNKSTLDAFLEHPIVESTNFVGGVVTDEISAFRHVPFGDDVWHKIPGLKHVPTNFEDFVNRVDGNNQAWQRFQNSAGRKLASRVGSVLDATDVVKSAWKNAKAGGTWVKGAAERGWNWLVTYKF